MHNYNEDFFCWLEKVKELEPKSHKDLPVELQQEFEKLMLLADIPFRKIYGEDPSAMEELLLAMLRPEEFYGPDGAPLKVEFIQEDRVFVSPVNDTVAQPTLYVEDDRGRRFVFLYCDWRGPHLGVASAIFDAIHDDCRKKGVPEQDLPDIYFIFLTDYDLCRQGLKVMRLDPEEEWVPVKHTAEEWRAEGCDPNQPDPAIEKWHTIFFNAAIV